MANLTITVDDETLGKARLKAVQQGTSVNALLRRYLEAFAGQAETRRAAIAAVLERSARSKAASGGRQWTRDELYERR